MEPNDKITELESEIKILKNEVQAVLLDLRDKYLEAENPFNAAPPSAAREQVIIDHQPTDSKAPDAPPANDAADAQKQEKQMEPEATGENETRPEAAHEEVERARMPEQVAHTTPSPATHSPDRKLDLVTISGLARWADESVRKLGRTRTETILDISEMMGFLPQDLKQVMTKLVSVEADGHENGAQAREYLDSLIEITTLLGKDNLAEETLLTILSGENNHR